MSKQKAVVKPVRHTIIAFGVDAPDVIDADALTTWAAGRFNGCVNGEVDVTNQLWAIRPPVIPALLVVLIEQCSGRVQQFLAIGTLG